MAKNNLRVIDNNSAYAIVNAAYKQAVGDAAVDTIDLKDFCDSGVAYDSLVVGRDKFFKALIDQVVNFYTETSYESEYIDPYFVDSARYASIIQMINCKRVPEAQSSHAWRDFSPNTSTTPPTYATVGTYEVKTCDILTTFFQKQTEWEIPLSISGTQMNTAFRNEGELRGFIDFLFVCVQNALAQHREQLAATNRNSMMAHLINAHNNAVPGIHKINLLTKYNAERGKNIPTVAGFMSDPDALRYAGSQLVLFEKYLRKPSTLFNTEGIVKFCPAERLVLEVNSAFENSVNEVALSNTFNENLASMPGNHISVPAWQGFGVDDAEASTEAASFDQVSKIDVTIDRDGSTPGTKATITQSGIVAFMADQYACMHTIKGNRTAHTRFDPEDLDMYFFQNTDMFCNNLAQNAVVFTVEAPSQPGPVSRLGIGDLSKVTEKAKVLNKNGKE